MNNQSIELIVIFKEGESNSAPLFNYLNKKLCEFFNIAFDEIAYSVKNTDNKRKDRNLKFKKDNVKKYESDLANNEAGFELLSYLMDLRSKSRDINISVSYNPKFFLDGDSSLIVTINKEFYFRNNDINNLRSLYLQIAELLLIENKKINYGFIFCMDNEKFPALFVAGIGNFNLTKNERNELDVWANAYSEMEYKIWRVFWGNLITINHLKPGFSIDKIGKIVGENNFFVVDNNTYFFNLPNNDLLYGNEHKDSKIKLLKLFNSLTPPGETPTLTG